jgi:hypothetical protein
MSILATASPYHLARHEIPEILLTPMNIQKQNTTDELGRIVEKDCFTHDQSYKWLSGLSVNSQVNSEELLPFMFGMYQADC